MHSFLDSFLFTWIILPALIFIARIMDMSLDTIRIVMIGQGRKVFAALCGFFEVTIWLLVARQVIAHLPNVACFFAYAVGFAFGNYVGMWIEERLAVGAQLIRVIIPHDGKALMKALKDKGYGATAMAGQGAQGEVNVIFTVTTRQDAKDVLGLVRDISPQAFYVVEDIRDVSKGIFPAGRRRGFTGIFRQLSGGR